MAGKSHADDCPTKEAVGLSRRRPLGWARGSGFGRLSDAVEHRERDRVFKSWATRSKRRTPGTHTLGTEFRGVKALRAAA